MGTTMATGTTMRMATTTPAMGTPTLTRRATGMAMIMRMLMA